MFTILHYVFKLPAKIAAPVGLTLDVLLVIVFIKTFGGF